MYSIAPDMTAEPAAGFDWWTSLVGPAVVAAVVAGLVSLIQIYVTGRRERRKQAMEFRLLRVNEFFAPIVLLLTENLSLVKALRASMATDAQAKWHLLEHLAEVRGDPQLKGIADRIVQVNSSIKTILEQKSGYSLAGDLPSSYSDFLAHADLLADAVQSGQLPKKVPAQYFPKSFETDIQKSYRDLVAQLRKDLREK